jgi:hypothetical protein
MRFQVFHRLCKAKWDEFSVARGAQVTRYTGYANNSAGLVKYGELGGETPTWFPLRVPVQFEMVHNWLSGTQNSLILPGIDFREFLREDLQHISSQQLLLVCDPASLHERLVDGSVSAMQILDEEGDLRHMVEDPLDHHHLDGPAQAGIRDRDWE